MTWLKFIIIAAMFTILVGVLDAGAEDESLGAGWNLIGDVSGTTPEFGERHPCALAIYGWDRERGDWLMYFLREDEALNRIVNGNTMLYQLLPSRGYWVYCIGGEQ